MPPMTPRQRLLTALRREVPDRVPCAPNIVRWTRHHHGCVCPLHLVATAETFGFDPFIAYGAYTWQSVSNDYVYTPAGGHGYAASGLYGDLPDVRVEMTIENHADAVLYRRTFHTPDGMLRDAIRWARPDRGYGDGPNPHREEPLVKDRSDLDALRHLFPASRRDVLADIPLFLGDLGDRALLAACDSTHAGTWGLEALGPEGMLIASVEDPDLLRDVCRMAQQAHLRNLRAMLERGLTAVYDSWFQCGPSVGWSPSTFREVFLPLIHETVDLAHGFGALYIYQDDGRMHDILPLVVDAGVDVLSGLQPPEVGDVGLAEAKARFGHRVALFGGLDPCYTFDLGSPDHVRRSVEQAIASAAEGGGYVLATAEAVAPETTPQCLQAMARAARASGTYH